MDYRLFYESHMLGVYEFQKPFDMYSCRDGRITVSPESLCKVTYSYGANILQFEFLRTKNTLPISANYSLMADFDNITRKVHLPERGETVEHQILGTGIVKDSNGVDKLLVEFSTIDKDSYKRDWFSISEFKYELEPETEKIVDKTLDVDVER